MKNAFWAYWLILLGIVIVVIMLLVQNLTTSSTQDYYLIKEITEASMIDAVDYSYYRTYGEIKINKEKFYESFIRRFSENAALNTTYTVSFYGVYEAPPKASVEIKSKSNTFNIVGSSTTFDMVERIDAILEGNTLENVSNTDNNENKNNETKTDTAQTAVTAKDIKDFIIKNRCRLGYYDCTNNTGNDEITVRANITAFACTNYSDATKTNKSECDALIDSVYDSLPLNIKHGQ